MPVSNASYGGSESPTSASVGRYPNISARIGFLVGLVINFEVFVRLILAVGSFVIN